MEVLLVIGAGVEKLTLTWKVNDKHNILQHVEIAEEDKPNPFTLGRRLIIGSEHFEDLDEILARYVQPMANFARDIIQHKNYNADLVADDIDPPGESAEDREKRRKTLVEAIETKLKEAKLADAKRFTSFC